MANQLDLLGLMGKSKLLLLLGTLPAGRAFNCILSGLYSICKYQRLLEFFVAKLSVYANCLLKPAFLLQNRSASYLMLPSFSLPGGREGEGRHSWLLLSREIPTPSLLQSKHSPGGSCRSCPSIPRVDAILPGISCSVLTEDPTAEPITQGTAAVAANEP